MSERLNLRHSNLLSYVIESNWGENLHKSLGMPAGLGREVNDCKLSEVN